MKLVKKNQLKIVIFTSVIYCCILHGHVFVMKDEDQLCGNRAADQCLCFHYIDLLIEKVEGLYYDDNSTIPLLSQSEILNL